MNRGCCFGAMATQRKGRSAECANKVANRANCDCRLAVGGKAHAQCICTVSLSQSALFVIAQGLHYSICTTASSAAVQALSHRF